MINYFLNKEPFGGHPLERLLHHRILSGCECHLFQIPAGLSVLRPDVHHIEGCQLPARSAAAAANQVRQLEDHRLCLSEQQVRQPAGAVGQAEATVWSLPAKSRAGSDAKV